MKPPNAVSRFAFALAITVTIAPAAFAATSYVKAYSGTALPLENVALIEVNAEREGRWNPTLVEVAASENDRQTRARQAALEYRRSTAGPSVLAFHPHHSRVGVDEVSPRLERRLTMP